MATLTLPQAGKSASATIRRWRKKVGDEVRKGDLLLEIETDEGVAVVEAAAEGTLAEILVGEGRTVAVKTPIAVIGTAPEKGKDVPTRAAAPQSGLAVQKKETAVNTTGKVVPILMPKAGQSMEEGTLVKWHVKVGDTIQKGQVIFEIETDKATMDVEATDAGRLAKIVLPEGGTLKVLEPVAYLADKDADVEAFLQSGSGFRVPGSGIPAPEPGTRPEPALSTQHAALSTDRVKASPAARKIADEKNIDLSRIGMGSGVGGRIISTDVLVAAPRKAAETDKTLTLPGRGQSPNPLPSPGVPGEAMSGAKRRKMSKMRKAIAANLALSKQTIPHFYLRGTINAEPLLTFYQGEKAKYPCSINDVIVMACAKAISEFAPFRSRIEGDEVVELPSANIGIAVGMDEGLVVPVLVAAEQMELKKIAAETKRIAGAAKAGKIEGMGQGVFTITNMGMFGVEEFAAIINPPEAAILAVGAAREEVIVSGGTLKAGKVMTMTLSVDHRVIDGMLAAKFMARLKELLEWPGQMI